MPLGILEPDTTTQVPGTCLLSDDPNRKALELYKGIDVGALKHGKGKCLSIKNCGSDLPANKASILRPADSDIILVPQPSDDLYFIAYSFFCSVSQ